MAKEEILKILADAVIEGNEKQGNEKPVEELAQKLSMKGVDAYNSIVK